MDFAICKNCEFSDTHDCEDCELIRNGEVSLEANHFEILEAVTEHREMYIVLNEGGTDGVIHYMGTNFDAANKVYRSTARSYIRGGFGGGDSAVCFYKYTGPDNIFDDLYMIWETDHADSELYYTSSIESLGFDPEYCELINATEC
jgi:hypothetical protein